MDIIQFFQDFNINYLTEGHKHCRPGWINTACPFCTGNPGYHLGVTKDGSHFYCWRCGWHPTIPTLAKLASISESKVKAITSQYIGFSTVPDDKILIGNKTHKLPGCISPLLPKHERYLAKRNFDPKKIEKEWDILGTGPISLLDGIDYGNRILAPIFWDRKQVTFQARDISNTHHLKYMACPKERELIHHKHIVYGKQGKWGSTAIVVEGITDVWRIGPLAVATFGIEFTLQQIRILSKAFSRIFIMFDDDPQAKIQAKKLMAELQFRGVEVINIDICGDPGGMTDVEIQQLLKNIL